MAFTIYGFRQWWPGCDDFNTGFQRSGTAERAQDVIARCPEVTAWDTRIALLVDTAFPLAYTILGAGLLLLMAGSRSSTANIRRWCVWTAVGFVVGGALDTFVENPSLFVVTLDHWPPRSSPLTSTLLLVAAVASWAKWVLLVAGVVTYALLLVRWTWCHLTHPSP